MHNKIKIYINGLRKGNGKGSTIAIFDLSQEKGSKKREIVNALSNEKGVVETFIDKRFAGKRVELVARDIGFKYFNIEIVIDKIGLFYPVKLEKDHIVDKNLIKKKHGNLKTWENWDSEYNYNEAREEVQKLVRKVRQKNLIAELITISILLGSPFLGLILIGWIGIIIGLVLGLISHFLTPKALGID